MSEAIIPKRPGKGGGQGEPLKNELWRFWATDIRPHFVAEADFLRKYGAEAGYETRYIARVLDDHQLLEALVWTRDHDNVRHFTGLLAAHIRFKEDYFKQRVRQIVESRETQDDAGDTGLSGRGS